MNMIYGIFVNLQITEIADFKYEYIRLLIFALFNCKIV